MPGFVLHPSTRLIVWLLFVIAIQSMSGTVLGSVVLLLPVLRMPILRRGWILIWRARWLLISLLLVFSWGVAGEPFWGGIISPTHEGLWEALNHLGRLLLVFMAVAALLETMPLSDLLSATHTFLKPLRHFGLNPDRGVVRLMLVLKYVETLPHPRDWRILLDAPVLSSSELVEVNHQPLRCLDYVVTFGFSVVVMFFVFARYMG